MCFLLSLLNDDRKGRDLWWCVNPSGTDRRGSRGEIGKKNTAGSDGVPDSCGKAIWQGTYIARNRQSSYPAKVNGNDHDGLFVRNLGRTGGY